MKFFLSRTWIWILLSTVTTVKSNEISTNKCPYLDNQQKNLKSKAEIGPTDLIKNLMPKAGKNLEHFVELELALESAADKSNLYGVPENERSEIMDSLRRDLQVQKTMDECNEFHVQPLCNESSLYSSLDGTCNNLKHPKWGSSVSEQVRLFPPVYEGVSGIRKSIGGKPLPMPRFISLKMKNEDHPSSGVSAFFTFFGQFIAHDMSMTPVFSKNNELIDCCDPSEVDNPRCAPIYYPADDSVYSKLKVNCQSFIRAAPYPRCDFLKRSPLTVINSFLDMSLIYGNNEAEDENLRRYDDKGRMKTRTSPVGETILCKNQIEGEVFCPYNMTNTCFRSGDHRVNLHTSLTTLHTLFMILHNIIALNLQQINEDWTGKRTFQEARRIVIAIMQTATYKEYLPFLIGTDLMQKYDLNLNLEDGSLYDEDLNPTVFAEFSAAAFRLHSMVPQNVSSSYPKLEFADTYSYFDPLYEGQSDCMIVGSCELPSQKNDRFFVGDVSHDLFKAPGATYGQDLTATNIQRGRDLGIPPYINILKHLSDGKTEIHGFEDLKKVMPESGINFLKTAYDFPADIDAYVGILTENPLPGLDIGPTAAEIIAKQFRATKFGDRYFVTHTNGRYPFTADQLKVIEDLTLSKILCLTTNSMEVRQHPLLLPHETRNPLVSCTALKMMNLSPWRDH